MGLWHLRYMGDHFQTLVSEREITVWAPNGVAQDGKSLPPFSSYPEAGKREKSKQTGTQLIPGLIQPLCTMWLKLWPARYGETNVCSKGIAYS